MLIQEQRVLNPGGILAMIAVNGNPAGAKELQTGIYEIGHYGSSDFLPGYEAYPKLAIGPYGVCDSIEQLLAACPELVNNPERQFVVTVTRVTREKEPAAYGWRWHKWGEYIGTQNPQHEYLYDEKHIESILVYHIYENERALTPQST